VCYRLLDHITVEWFRFAPELLGTLTPLVRGLPPGETITDYYLSPSTSLQKSKGRSIGRPVPYFLLQIITIREALAVQEPWTIPLDCTTAIVYASDEVRIARDEYRSICCKEFGGSADPEKVSAAQQRLKSAYDTLKEREMDAESRLLQRQETWDRVIYLLRGQTFISKFQFDSDAYPKKRDEYPVERENWRNVLPTWVCNRPLY
jgi:hypothetical protein